MTHGIRRALRVGPSMGVTAEALRSLVARSPHYNTWPYVIYKVF